MFSLIFKNLNPKKTSLIRDIIYSDNTLIYHDINSFLLPEIFIDNLLEKKDYFKDHFYSAFDKNKKYLIRIGNKYLSNFLYIYDKKNDEYNKKILYSDDNFFIYYKIMTSPLHSKYKKLDEEKEIKNTTKKDIFENYKLIEPKKEWSYCDYDI